MLVGTKVMSLDELKGCVKVPPRAGMMETWREMMLVVIKVEMMGGL